MFRFKAIFALVAIAAGASFQVHAKEKPPQISVCYGGVCLTGLRWAQPDSFMGTTSPAVEGVLVNNSNITLRFLSLDFQLVSGSALVGTAVDSFSGIVPPGGQWRFHAAFAPVVGRSFVTVIASAVLSCTGFGADGARQRVSQQMDFDPLFAPFANAQRKAWEKIHGKRQR